MSINFHTTQFEISASRYRECPPALVPELVFAGRSNAGKSSTINVLCNQRQLAYASRMPGRTQLLNFFHVIANQEPIARLVDLPGYGFAALAKSSRTQWDRELGDYLELRPSIRGVVLIIDIRRGLLPLDIALLNVLKPRKMSVHILLSKADKLNRQAQTQALRTASATISALQLNPVPSTQLWSATSKLGLEQLQTTLSDWISPVCSSADTHLPKP